MRAVNTWYITYELWNFFLWICNIAVQEISGSVNLWTNKQIDWESTKSFIYLNSNVLGLHVYFIQNICRVWMVQLLTLLGICIVVSRVPVYFRLDSLKQRLDEIVQRPTSSPLDHKYSSCYLLRNLGVAQATLSYLRKVRLEQCGMTNIDSPSVRVSKVWIEKRMCICYL